MARRAKSVELQIAGTMPGTILWNARFMHTKASVSLAMTAKDKTKPTKPRQSAKSGASRNQPGSSGNRWSRDVTQHSNALDLEPDVFTKSDPKAIARSLKRSAEASTRRKGTPYQSAMSMLTFYVNRAGSQLDARQRKVLESAKAELRKAFHRA